MLVEFQLIMSSLSRVIAIDVVGKKRRGFNYDLQKMIITRLLWGLKKEFFIFFPLKIKQQIYFDKNVDKAYSLNKNPHRLNLGLHPTTSLAIALDVFWKSMNNSLLLWVSSAGAGLLEVYMGRHDSPNYVHSNENDMLAGERWKLCTMREPITCKLSTVLRDEIESDIWCFPLKAISFDTKRQAKWKQEGWRAEVRGRPFITHTKLWRGTSHKWFYCLFIAALSASISISPIQWEMWVVPSISSAVSATEARNGNESQLKKMLDYKK